MKHSIVLFSKHAIVIGPTPPGTGVIALATLETSSKSTSPIIPEFVLLIPSIPLGMGLVPLLFGSKIKPKEKFQGYYL